MNEASSLPRVVVLASTYPRWQNDHEPSFVHELAKRLVGRFQVIAVVPHARGAARREILDGVNIERYRYAPSMMETLVNDGGIVTNLKRAPWRWLLVPGFLCMQWWEASRILRAGDVVHAHWIVPQGLIARLLRAPYLLTAHGADVFSLRGAFATVAKGWSLRRASCVTVVSAAMLEPLSSIAVTNRVSVQSMGVDLNERFTPDPGTPRSDRHLLFVGRLVDKKGVDLLLKAMPAIQARHPGVHLTVVGHGPLRLSLELLTIELGLQDAVTFKGALEQSELAAEYRRAALFVAPFRVSASGDQEGLGLVMIESLGCGCPVVACGIDAVRELATDMAGITLAPPEDVNGLSQTVNRALADLPAVTAMVDAGREGLIARFDWNRVADAYASILLSLGVGACR